MEKLAGYVEHIIYRNTDNGYTVLNLVSGEDEITCVGIFSTIAEGENIEDIASGSGYSIERQEGGGIRTNFEETGYSFTAYT